MTQNAVPQTATTPPLHREPEAGSNTAVALQRAVAHLMGLQQDDGWWRGELETQVTMDAEDLLLREFLRIRGAADTEEAAHCIRSQQPDDGTWATFYGGPRGAVHVVVVESGNSRRLVDVAEREGRPAQLVVFGVD